MATPIRTLPHTVYVKNLNDRVKADRLRSSLYFLFSQCGEVLEVVLRKGSKYRGQAWIVFKDGTHAERAITTLNTRIFFGKPLSLAPSLNKSDIIAKADGTYLPPELRKMKALEDESQNKKRKLDHQNIQGDTQMDDNNNNNNKIQRTSYDNNNTVESTPSLKLRDDPSCWIVLKSPHPTFGLDQAKELISSYTGFIDVVPDTVPDVYIAHFTTKDDANECIEAIDYHRIGDYRLRAFFADKD